MMSTTYPAALFVAISTEQNTTNLMPLLTFGARRVLLLETSRAHQQEWSKGLISALRESNIHVEARVVPQAVDANIGQLLGWLMAQVAHEKQVLWILGGGQTPYRIAPFMAFDQRSLDKEPGTPNDHVLYSIPPRTFMDLHYEGNDLVQTLVPYGAAPSVDTIVTCFGRSIFKKDPIASAEPEEINRFFTDASWRKQLYQHRARPEFSQDTRLFEGLEHLDIAPYHQELTAFLEKLILNQQTLPRANSPSSPAELARFLAQRMAQGGLKSLFLTPPTHIETATRQFKSFGAYFEWILQSLVNQNTSLPAWGNVQIYQNYKSESEHDVLLVKHDGTLISLDAKTFDVDRKDLLARLLNMQRTGGSFSRFIPVFPYFLEDLSSMSRELRNLPFVLDCYRTQFYVVSNETNPHYIVKTTAGIKRTDHATPDAILLTPLPAGLRELEK